MKQLLLLRHAHAEEARPGLEDIDRPLSLRGRAEALDAAQCIAEAGLRCDAVLVSPAVRATETATIVGAELDLVAGLCFEPALYLGTAEALLAPLRRCPSGLETVLVVGHNPGLSAFAQRFNSVGPAIELRTAGLCAITFAHEAAWSELRPQLATVMMLLR
jgi:phosphohistidine phosphatase